MNEPTITRSKSDLERDYARAKWQHGPDHTLTRHLGDQLETVRAKERARTEKLERAVDSTREEALKLAARDQAPPHQPGSYTSKQAADWFREHASNARVAVLAYLLTRTEGATDQEMAETLAWTANTIRPRRVELVKMGLVTDSGRRRETVAGLEATVWVAWKHTDDQMELMEGGTRE